jgi:hypothetical protein
MDEIDNLLNQLWQLNNEVTSKKNELATIEGQVATTRQAIVDRMIEAGVASKIDPEGYFKVSLVNGKDWIVSDRGILEASLDEMGQLESVMVTETVTKMDMARVKDVAKVLPVEGITQVPYTRLRLTPITKEVQGDS